MSQSMNNSNVFMHPNNSMSMVFSTQRERVLTKKKQVESKKFLHETIKDIRDFEDKNKIVLHNSHSSTGLNKPSSNRYPKIHL